jgi:hypothetical protein
MINTIRQKVEAQIIAKAWQDAAFRARLLADPKAVYGEELAKIQPGATLPATLSIQVVEETPTTLYLVLPIDPDAAEGVLTEEELEAIAGGIPWMGPRYPNSDGHYNLGNDWGFAEPYENQQQSGAQNGATDVR